MFQLFGVFFYKTRISKCFFLSYILHCNCGVLRYADYVCAVLKVGTLCQQSIVSLHVHQACLSKTAQNIRVYSTLTHRAGEVGNFFFYKSVQVHFRCDLSFGGFSSGNFCGIFLRSVWRIFVVIFSSRKSIFL